MPEWKERCVEVALGGESRMLRMNLNTMATFEERTGRKPDEIPAMMQEVQFGTLRQLLACLLSDVDEGETAPTANQVGRMIDMDNLGSVVDKLNELMTGRAADPRMLAPFVPTPHEAVAQMLDVAELGAGETLVDLGAGDGRILRAAGDRGALAIGYEINDERHAALVNLGFTTWKMDAMDADISRADVITLYLLTSSNEKLRDKLERECKPGARIVSYCFPMPGWDDGSKFPPAAPRLHPVYLWRRPGTAVPAPAAEEEAVSV
jgi:hypothetical protein